MATEQFLLYVIQSVTLKQAEAFRPVAIDIDSNDMLRSTAVGTYNDCCRKCATHVGCTYWQWIPYLAK